MRCLIVLLVCVPLQYALIAYRRPAEMYVLGLIRSWTKTLTSWKDYLFDMLKANFEDVVQDSNTENEIVNNDVDDDLNSEIKTVRSRRPEPVKFRVGEVILNTKLGFVGIVVGWNFKEGQEPVYEVLTDHPSVPDYKAKSLQKDLLRLKHIQIFHEEAIKYFEFFDHNKSQYVPKPWLRIIYPAD